MPRRYENDPMLTRLALDMKAVALLYPAEADLRAALTANVLDSRDEGVRRVVESLSEGKPRRGSGPLVVAVGELILASFLMASGLVAIASLFGGGSNPAQVIQYFSGAVGGISGAEPFTQVLPLIEVGLSVALLLSALYALRRASVNIKEAGFVASG